MGHTSAAIESFHTLAARYADPDVSGTTTALEASLSAVLVGASDPGGIVGYLEAIGLRIVQLDDLLLVNEVSDEEELSAHRVAEGVALNVASDGSWVLFRP